MKKKELILSRYAKSAVMLLASLIKAARIQKRMTAEELANRMGVSRSLIHRMEKGDPACAVGTVFEAASILGIPLFQSDYNELQVKQAFLGEKLALLPSRAKKIKAVDDDF